MGIKGEANALKIEVAKNLKQLSDKVVIGKNTENNTTEIKIEDKSKHLTVNMTFILTGSVTPAQIGNITERVKSILDAQSKIVKSSGDKAFASYASQGTPSSIVSTGTTSALILENRDYLMEGTPEPKFIKNFKNLPGSVTVFNPQYPS